MTNLPEQAHQRGTAVATRPEDDAYNIDQSMVKLPSLYLAQYSSKAFKARRVGFGALYIGIGAEDPNPVIVADATDGERLSDPVRFYVHSVGPGFQIVDESAPYGKRTLRFGTTFRQALDEAGGDPRNVFQQSHYTLTVPDYAPLPVRFIMGSRWGGNAGRWLNSQIAILRQSGARILDTAFQVQTKPDSNDSGEFVSAVPGFASVKAKQAAADQELVAVHAEIVASVPRGVVEEEAPAEAADTSQAPPLD